MARPRERVCLEQGLKLDLVQLARRGFIKFGANVGPRGIQWNDRTSGEVTASGVITADMSGSDFGWLQINMENFQQCDAWGQIDELFKKVPHIKSRRRIGE